MMYPHKSLSRSSATTLAVCALVATVAAAARGAEATPALTARFVLAEQDSGSCDLGDDDKQDCGHVGTEQQDCENSGCCWKPSQNQGTPWCYYKSGDAPTCPLKYTSQGAPFSDTEVATMRKYFLANINIDGSGGVVAAPDYNTPGGSYYYHWERDGALSTRALLRTADKVSDVQPQLDAYAGWVSRVQQEQDPNGQSVLAEPKYFIPNGTVYTGGWCRPQNDGPGLRALSLIAYAEALQADPQTAAKSSVSTADLWKLIQTDLDWAAANWQAQGCDLWEEIRSDDFFWNRYTARAALVRGSAFAKSQGDSGRSSNYASAASAINQTLPAHYSNGFVFEAQSRQKDSSVICAFNDGYIDGDIMFGPTSVAVAGTVKTLNDLFCTSFAINQADTKAGVPGILYGRYQGDGYAGGNPWVLLTSALAELLYRGAAETMKSGKLESDSYSAWAPILGLDSSNSTLRYDSKTVAAAFAGAADGVLTRLHKHVSPRGFHLDEQIDRNTGVSMAAKDLTWSYAATLKAVQARSDYYSML